MLNGSPSSGGEVARAIASGIISPRENVRRRSDYPPCGVAVIRFAANLVVSATCVADYLELSSLVRVISAYVILLLGEVADPRGNYLK